jgi:hypothetical protein
MQALLDTVRGSEGAPPHFQLLRPGLGALEADLQSALRDHGFEAGRRYLLRVDEVDEPVRLNTTFATLYLEYERDIWHFVGMRCVLQPLS